MPNIWSVFARGPFCFHGILNYVRNMLHDPAVYTEPEKFDPSRYQNRFSEMDKVMNLVFGFGRRACPGVDFADGTIFAAVATILATCEILPEMSSSGQEIIPNGIFSSATAIM